MKAKWVNMLDSLQGNVDQRHVGFTVKSKM